jgi:hypothetical protein
MSDEPAKLGTGDLLQALGKVQMPEPRVLDDAREVLWSAIADKMLGIGAAGGHHRRKTRRRQTDLPGGERRMSMGGGDS